MNYMQAGAATWHDTTGPPPQAFDLGLTSALRIKKEFNALYQHKSSWFATAGSRVRYPPAQFDA